MTSEEKRLYYKAWRAANLDKSRKASAEYRQRNREKCREMNRDWKARNPDKVAALNRKRQATQLHRTPVWADLKAIQVFYEEARRLTAETGIEHHVDHVIPLQGNDVCGLHVQNNLQVISATDNMAKGNRL